VRRGHTTISCRAFALTALLIAGCSGFAAAADRPAPPKLPLAQWWSVSLDGPVSAGPVAAGARVYLAFASGQLSARDAADGRELWRQSKRVSSPMVGAGDLLLIASGDAVEALQGANGRSAWVMPRVTPIAPLIVAGDLLIAVTDKEVIAARATTGEVAWRRAATGVKLAPAIDGDRVYVGADDGAVTALSVTDGGVAWQKFVPDGVTAIGAYKGRVYVGGGDKILYCLDAKKGAQQWPYRIGAQAIGHISVDDDRVYVAARDNVARAFDRNSGNQRWQRGLPQRPSFGVYASGHVVFVPANASQVFMLYDRTGEPSGQLNLPGDVPPTLGASINDSPDGAIVYVATGGLTNEWSLTKYAPAGETALLPFATLNPMPGVPYLTDPLLMPIGNVLKLLILGDPLLVPLSEAGWPIVLADPPLVPLTVLPGLQLRPLSPVLPVRPAGRGPGG
jgi:outer membrane protein assembly factor BamB